jgi:hypothetical protein
LAIINILPGPYGKLSYITGGDTRLTDVYNRMVL